MEIWELGRREGETLDWIGLDQMGLLGGLTRENPFAYGTVLLRSLSLARLWGGRWGAGEDEKEHSSTSGATESSHSNAMLFTAPDTVRSHWRSLDRKRDRPAYICSALPRRVYICSALPRSSAANHGLAVARFAWRWGTSRRYYFRNGKRVDLWLDGIYIHPCLMPTPDGSWTLYRQRYTLIFSRTHSARIAAPVPELMAATVPSPETDRCGRMDGLGLPASRSDGCWETNGQAQTTGSDK